MDSDSGGPGWQYWVLLAAILAALGLGLFHVLKDVVRAWRAEPQLPRRAVLSAAVLIALGAVLSTRGVEMRAGRHNEHALLFLASASFEKSSLSLAFSEKEASPRVLLSTYELVVGRSLTCVRFFQLLGWVLSAFFVFGALWRGGAGVAGGAAAAVLLLFNSHAVEQAHSFSPDLACVLMLTASVYAVVIFAVETDSRRAERALAALGAAVLLAFTAKFEFGLIVLVGAVVAVLAGGAPRPRSLPLAAAGAAGVVALCGLFLSISSKPENKLLPAELFGLLDAARFALGNLREQLGLDAAGAAAAAALFGAAWTKARRTEPGRFFWAAFLSVWIALIGVLYLPMAFYPLSHSRHHLFVFLPFSYLFGVMAGRLMGDAPGAGRRTAVVAGLALLLGAYAVKSLERVSSYRGYSRTSDRELSFLLDSRSDWPAGCFAFDPLPGLRPFVLRKYFPYWTPADGPPPPCLLIYRSPRSGRAYGPRSGGDRVVDDLRLPAWRERSFEHRWFTDWQGPWDWPHFELLAPVPVTIGFYRAGPADWLVLNERLMAAAAPPQPAAGEVMSARWGRSGYHPLDSSYLRSVEFCFKRALTDAFMTAARRPGPGDDDLGLPSSAADCFDAGVREAAALGDVADEIDLLAAKASYLQGLGRDGDARAALAQARATAKKADYRGWALVRAEFAERGMDPDPSRGYNK